MTEEEIAALEARLDEEAGLTFEPNMDYYIGQGQAQTKGVYVNKQLSCTFPSGSVLKIGVDTTETGALYLNPVYENVEEEIVMSDEMTAFAFYFLTSFRDDVETSAAAASAYDVGGNIGAKNYVVTNRTYDTLVPATYLTPENYGVRWKDINNFHGFDGRSCDMYTRVVRLPDGQLMGTAKIEIVFNEITESYEIMSLSYDDVSATGELTAAERDLVLERAFAFFCDDSKNQSTFIDTAYWETYKPKAVVEKIDGFYFPKLFGARGEVISAGKYNGMHVYAVNINYPGYGFATIYVAPQKQIDGLRSSVSPNDDLQAFAFDAFKPFTSSTLFVPAFQQDEFYPSH